MRVFAQGETIVVSDRPAGSPSILDVVARALGSAAVTPQEPERRGEAAVVGAPTGQLTVERSVRADGDVLAVVTRDGARFELREERAEGGVR